MRKLAAFLFLMVAASAYSQGTSLPCGNRSITATGGANLNNFTVILPDTTNAFFSYNTYAFFTVHNPAQNVGRTVSVTFTLDVQTPKGPCAQNLTVLETCMSGAGAFMPDDITTCSEWKCGDLSATAATLNAGESANFYAILSPTVNTRALITTANAGGTGNMAAAPQVEMYFGTYTSSPNTLVTMSHTQVFPDGCR